MKEKSDCKIIQDYLLPNYIEKLTDEETNNYIEKHLNECEECRKILEDMKNKLNLNVPKLDKSEVKYMKKFRNKIRLLKFIILAIVLGVLISFIILTARKMIIIADLSNKAKKYVNSDNIHMISYSYNIDGFYSRVEWYYLKDKVKEVAFVTEENELTDKVIRLGNNKIVKDGIADYYKVAEYSDCCYIDEKNKKLIWDGSNINGINGVINIFYTENLWELFKYAIKVSIKEGTFNGKKCYYVDKLNEVKDFSKALSEDTLGIIDKETGLLLFMNNNNTNLSMKVTEINTVTEDDFKEPDLSDYEVMTALEYAEKELSID